MGAEYVFYAKRSDASEEMIYNSRGNRAFELPLSCFRHLVPAHYHKDDTAQGYPSYEITKDAWSRWISLLRGQMQTVEYLSGFVLSSFDFDEFVPEELDSLDNIDQKKLFQFRTWLYNTFPHTCQSEEGSDAEELIIYAYMLHCWLDMDAEVQQYLADGCRLWMCIA